jgi:hypothetical protein
VGKPYFRVKPGPLEGSVDCIAKAVDKVADYLWQWSDDDRKTWHDAGRSLEAKMRITGLESGKVYWFRFRVTVRGGLRDWCEPLALRVP